MSEGDDKAADDSGKSLTSELAESGDASHHEHTVTEIPEKTAHRQRYRRSSGAHLSHSGLPLADPDHYELREEVARGGLGRIIAAFDNRLGRDIALKELVVRHPVSEARFSREAKLTASLQHPAIIPVHDAGVWENGHPFYAMKLVDGRSLATAIQATNSYEERIAMLSHVVDVADAMAYAHSQRIIHRDLKPANILVGAFGETVVIDWGLAKNLDQTNIEDEQLVTTAEIRPKREYETNEGAVLGTPAYMPPEQARGESVDERADVYALGALLYHLLAGKRPYFEIPPVKLLDVVVDEEPTPLGELVPEIPADLLAIVTKAMARSRGRRYADAGELADELHKFTTGQLVGAYRYSSKELLLRFVRRHQRVLLTVAVSVAILLAYGVWSLVRITSERNRAEEAVAEQSRLRLVAEKAAASEAVARNLAQAKTARLLLATDPTEAVATLKLLGAPVAGAASIIAEAQELGIARHVFHNPEFEQVRAVVTGEGVVAWSDDGGNVVVHKDGHLEVLPLHRGHRVPALDVSRDGTSLVSGGYDGKVLVTELGGLETKALGTMRGAIRDAALSPDGSRVAAISSEGMIALWSLATGERQEWTTEVGRTAFLRFSSDGSALVSGPHGNTALLLDLEGGPVTYLTGHTGAVNDAAFSPDGNYVATASSDSTVRVWTRRGAVKRVLTKHRAGVKALAFSGSGDFIASGDMDGRVRRAPWKSGEGREIGRHNERVTRVGFALQDEIVVSVSWDKTARVFSSAGAERILKGHRDVISSMAISRDGKTLVTGSWDTFVRVWNLSSPTRRVLSGHRVGVKAVAFSPDGHWVASGAHDNQVRLWDPATGQMRIYRGHSDHIFRVAFSPDGALLASSSDDQRVRIWDVKGSARPRVLRGHRADVEELAWSSDGKVLASAAEDNTARLWSMDKSEPLVLRGHERAVSDVAISENGRLAATSSLDGTVRVWPTDGRAPTVLAGHEGGALAVEFVSTASLVSLGSDEVVKRWNLLKKQDVTVAKGLAGARVMAISSDGKQVAIGGAGGMVWVCPLQAESTCRELRGHVGTIWQLAFSPDASLLATGGADNTVRIWEVGSGEHRVLFGHTAPVFDLAFSPDGKSLASGSGDATVRIWNVRKPPTNLDSLDELTSHTVGGQK